MKQFNLTNTLVRVSALLSVLLGTALLCGGASDSVPGSEARVSLPAFTKVKLDNGLVLLLMERHELPLVSITWLLRSGGSIADPNGQEGLASVTAQLLRKGTATRTADAIAETLDFIGAEFEADATQDFATGSIEVLSKDFQTVSELLADVLMKPTFPEAEVSKLKLQEIDGIKEAKAVPNAVIGRYFHRFLFGTHPYARPVSGTEQTLETISRKDVVQFHATHYAPNQMILAIVGDIKAEEVTDKLRHTFGAWKSQPAHVQDLSAPVMPAGRRALVVEKPDATQTFFNIGSIGVARTNSDWIPLHVVNTLFGGRFTSMINTALRIESGLTYGARSAFTTHPVPGSFVISSFTPNDSTERALEMTLDILGKLQQTGINDLQLASAKAYIKGQFGPTLETNDQLAGTLCDLEFYGLGPEYINNYFEKVDAVTLEDARRLIQDYYPLKNLCIVLIGQEKIIVPAAEKIAAKVEKTSITTPGF